jgi:hypothetical protein
MNTEATLQEKQAASWILKGLCTNRHWFDDIRHAGRENFEREYHYIPLIDLAQASARYDIRTLKNACYLLQTNHHIDIWGDDYEAYGMLVQVSPAGVNAHEELYYGKENKNIINRAIGVFTMLTIVIAIAVGLNKTLFHKHNTPNSTESSVSKDTGADTGNSMSAVDH